MPVDAYKNLGLFSALILFFGLFFVVKCWPYGLNRTFSQHIARSKTAIVYYTVLFLVALSLLMIFFVGWFIPTFHLSGWFTALVIVASVMQVGCTLVPETGGVKSQVHRVLAFFSADCLLPALVIVALANTVSQAGRITSVIASVVMVALILIMLKNQTEHRYLLLIQTTYFLVFFIAILTATYAV